MGRSKTSVSSMHVGAREWRPNSAHGAFIASRHPHTRYAMACQIVACTRETVPKLTDMQRERLETLVQTVLPMLALHMPTQTIRQLDDKTKNKLRVRAAQH